VRPRAEADEFERLPVRHRFLVRAAGPEGVVHIRQGKDPPRQRDFVPAKALRIAASIPFLVMAVCNVTGNGQKPRARKLSQRRANGVVEYLVTQGISRNRLRPVGYGEVEPRNRCRRSNPKIS